MCILNEKFQLAGGISAAACDERFHPRAEADWEAFRQVMYSVSDLDPDSNRRLDPDLYSIYSSGSLSSK